MATTNLSLEAPQWLFALPVGQYHQLRDLKGGQEMQALVRDLPSVSSSFFLALLQGSPPLAMSVDGLALEMIRLVAVLLRVVPMAIPVPLQTLQPESSAVVRAQWMLFALKERGHLEQGLQIAQPLYFQAPTPTPTPASLLLLVLNDFVPTVCLSYSEYDSVTSLVAPLIQAQDFQAVIRCA